MTNNPDKQLFLVILNDDGAEYVAERELSEMDSRNTLQSIAAGEWTNLSRVLVFNPVEHICSDVTDEFARAVMNIWASNGESLTAWQRKFIEENVSVRVANSFPRAA